jgi:hypothetical protein
MSFNLWNHKPWWCQPWSILLTGITIITGSWWLFANLWLTLFASILILFWWFYFLILYPRLMAQIIESETKNTIK